MWTKDALLEALGPPDVQEYSQGSAVTGRNLPVMRWHCRSGIVSAFGNVEGGFNVEADCKDQRHNDLQHMSRALVRNVQLRDRANHQPVSALPGDLAGVSLDFQLDTPAPIRLRVEAYLDPELKFRAVEEFDAGSFLPGLHDVTIPLSINPNGPGSNDGPARSIVELRMEILDTKTGERDWGANGILLYRQRFNVRRSEAAKEI